MLTLKVKNSLVKAFTLRYDNDVDIFIPEMWANESIAILLDNMIAANLVYRDFENVLANYGDTVNIPKPGTFVAQRKTNTDNVVIQDATAERVQVKLDQHLHTSFMIMDGEESLAFKDLVDEFLRPAVISLAKIVDQIVLGQYPQFLGNIYGQVGGMDASNASAYLLGVRQIQNQQRAPLTDRNMIVNPVTETQLLSNPNFLLAYAVGDDGTALREANLGRKYGYNFFMDQNMASVNDGVNTVSDGAINNGAGYSVGATALIVDGITGAIATGTWLTIDGDNQPHRVVAHTETAGNTTAITLESGLNYAVVDNAVITFYTPGSVNNASGYAAGWNKQITIQGFTVAPQVGQIVSFTTNTAPDLYTIIGVNGTTGITLDRSLVNAIANNDPVNIGPAGSFNLAMHRNAIALVVRPLARPRQGTGALSAVVNFNGVSMRVTITYQGVQQGHLVTVDMLCGISVLDKRLGAVLVG